MDDPDIDARQFLARVMHETTLDLAVRMEAADKLLQVGCGHYREQHIRITINGGIPMLGVADADRIQMKVKGHA
jgi:hypothetical protein